MFMEENATIVWLVIMIILVAIELVTVGLATIWFAVGALVAIIAASLGLNVIGQIVVFLLVSISMLIFTRPFAVKVINKSKLKTNYESVIGTLVKITQTVDNVNGTGCAKVNGQEWTVRSQDESEIIEAGKMAKVMAVSGVKLIVKEFKEEEKQCHF